MTFTLRVDRAGWLDAVRALGTEFAGACGDPAALVPVVKGEGYGFGMSAVCAAATELGVTTLAVETPFEAREVIRSFAGDVQVMQPWEPGVAMCAQAWDDLDAMAPGRVIRTIASNESLHAFAASHPGLGVAPSRVVLDGLTSLWRRGFAEPDLDALLADTTVLDAICAGRIRVEGLALNLPISQPSAPRIAAYQRPSESGSESAATGAPSPLPGDAGKDAAASGRYQESLGWALTWLRALAAFRERTAAQGSRLGQGGDFFAPEPALWISHASPDELQALHAAVPAARLHARVGRDLWLQHRGAAVATGTVLAVHAVTKGQPIGHSQRRSPRDGLLLAVAGGSHHGVSADARTPSASWRKRMTLATLGALEATGRFRSPFVWEGKCRWFVEAPDTHVSLLLLTSADLGEAKARGHREPAVGDELVCRVSLDTARFDQVVFTGNDQPVEPTRIDLTDAATEAPAGAAAGPSAAWNPLTPRS